MSGKPLPNSLSDRPLPSSFDDNEDFYNANSFQKITRKIKQEPLIPIGCALTVAAFTSAYRAMRRGDHAQVQRMFRARVLAQSFTVIAIAGGGIYYGAERHREREVWREQQRQKEEDKKQKWIRELEVRDEEEKALLKRLERRKQKAAERDAAANEGGAGVLAQVQAERALASEDKPEGTSILGSLGGIVGGQKPADGGSKQDEQTGRK